MGYVVLWHCGPFPLSQNAESGIDSEAGLVNQRSWFRDKDGKYTIARLDQESGNYMILPLVADTTKGPQPKGGACEVFSVNLPFCGKKVCFQGRAFKVCPNYNIS